MKIYIKMNDYLFFVVEGRIIAVPMVILKIQRAWRKWFLRKVRECNDPLKRELTAYIYHPKRLSFNI